MARWTSDCGPGRERAQRSLVLGAASFAKAGIAASARVGDEGLNQSIEDELRSFPATEVILVTGPGGDGADQETAVSDLQSRLTVPFQRFCADEDVSKEGAERLDDRRSAYMVPARIFK